ncbi:MAG: hypothetical protein HC880_09720 [Bacteroidia bacterium]|nr:hypothetical protein [Bacteroidia bacterium]
MGLLIFGIACVAIGGLLLYTRQSSLSRAMDIKYYETSKVSEVVGIYQPVKEELGVGNYSGIIVELSGIANSDSPITAQHSKRPALYVEAWVNREYEVTEQQRDDKGNYRTVTVRRSETVSRHTNYVPFYLDDGSGATVRVDMNGAKKDLITSQDRYEPESSPGFGHDSSRTLGYRYQEKIIPNGARLYVLGELSDRDGELTVVKPAESGKQFIVSTKSEQELIKRAESSAQWKLVGAIIIAVAGLGIVVASFF